MGAACHSFSCNNHFDLFSLPGTQHFNSSRIHKNNGRNLHTGLLHVCLRCTVTYSVHNKSTLQILLFQESHLISYWPMKQRRVRGKWTINLCNVIHGLSAVSKCLLRQPSKPAVKRILQKRNLSRAGLSLYPSPARQQQGIKHIIFQRSVHFSYRLAFYVLCTPAQGRTAVWAPHPLQVSKERERERTHFSGRSGAECQTQWAGYLRTNRSCRPRPASAITLP